MTALQHLRLSYEEARAAWCLADTAGDTAAAAVLDSVCSYLMERLVELGRVTSEVRP